MTFSDLRARAPNTWPHKALWYLEDRLRRNYQSLLRIVADLRDVAGTRVFTTLVGVTPGPSFVAAARGPALAGDTTITIDGLPGRTPLSVRSWLVIAGQRYNVTADVQAAPNGVLTDCPIEQPRAFLGAPVLGLAADVADNDPVEVWVGRAVSVAGWLEHYEGEPGILVTARDREYEDGRTGAQIIADTDSELLDLLNLEYLIEVPGTLNPAITGGLAPHLDGDGNVIPTELSGSERTQLADAIQALMG